MKEVVIIGYSGHAYVACDILARMGRTVVGYCDKEEQEDNPLTLKYFGDESDKTVLDQLMDYECFVAIGNNEVRRQIGTYLTENQITLIKAIHPDAIVSSSASIGAGAMIGPGAIVNAFATIDEGAICNSRSVIEHECNVGEYSHIGPGAVLGGNVRIGNNTLIGAGAVVLLNLQVGSNTVIGAGSVVINNIGDNKKAVGNPCRYI